MRRKAKRSRALLLIVARLGLGVVVFDELDDQLVRQLGSGRLGGGVDGIGHVVSLSARPGQNSHSPTRGAKFSSADSGVNNLSAQMTR
jgi:hypothetical protein